MTAGRSSPTSVGPGPVRRWSLPDVPPRVARRRRRFFSGVGLLVVAAVAVPILRGGATAASALQHAGAAEPRTGCTLRTGGAPVTLDVALAMRLTDIAGRDQNAGATVQQTAASVAAAWPAQASRADAVASSLRGYVPGALECTGALPSVQQQPMDADGLTARGNALWDAVKNVFGPLPAGGFMPGGARTGHIPGSAHYEGRAIDFIYRPITAKSVRHGWVLAQWLEAHSAQLQVATVIFDARIWTPGVWDRRGWRAYTYPDGPTTNPTLMHYDHVHVDVQRGG